jgi:hypothetical protein
LNRSVLEYWAIPQYSSATVTLYRIVITLTLCIDFLQNVIVFSVNGVLCFEDYEGINPGVFDSKRIRRRPGLHGFFRNLLNYFHVGIWSSMPAGRLRHVIQFLLPQDITSQLLFVYGRNKCHNPDWYPYCEKRIQRLTKDFRTREICRPDRILMVDDSQWRNRPNGNLCCYFPRSWKGELEFPNSRNVIPNISTALLPFIMPLFSYESVSQFLLNSEMDGKFRRRLLREARPHL